MGIIKDTDSTIEIILKDETGAFVDLSTLSGYIVEISQANQNLFDQFSKNAQTGYRSVNETDPTNGKFEIYLNAANTAIGQINKEVFYEVKILAVNANFDTATEEKSTGPIPLGPLLDSKTQNQSFV